MLTHCLAVTTGLIVVSILSKVLFENNVTAEQQIRMLVDQSLHWRDVATNDKNPVVKLEHFVTASTFLNAARSIANDVEVERASGIDVARLAQELEREVVACRPKSRQNVLAATKPEPKPPRV